MKWKHQSHWDLGRGLVEGTEISETKDGSMLVMVEEQLEGKFGMKSGKREEMKVKRTQGPDHKEPYPPFSPKENCPDLNDLFWTLNAEKHCPGSNLTESL